MQRWIITGVSATVVIILSLSLYASHELNRASLVESNPPAGFVTSQACADCHKKEFDQWQQSHHAKSMAVATEATVLGDFNDVVFEKNGVQSRFYRKGDDFYVFTRGPQGKMVEYKISHTFGWYPLQQYLIPFPGGRLQCLPIAWDSREKKWFHLYPDLNLDPEEWIYWTNQGQNWNSMCADCQSTRLQKNYDPAADSYATQWSEISVGCESCHGPGSRHLAWAKLPEAARLQLDNGLVVQASRTTTNRQQVELCAPCHSRRSMLNDYIYQQDDLLDTEVPRLLDEGLYFADGQIHDEVYVYGSFVQSKMYAHGVRCSDCHNPHTITLHAQDNKLCLQCHQGAVYDDRSHHFHKREGEKGEPIRLANGTVLFEVGSGALCVQCHMPGRTYMGNDYRPEHSIRIPRPDLSVTLGTPNACNRCHRDKTNEWSAEYTKKWYGSKDKFHFAATFAAARRGEPAAEHELLKINADPLTPILVRATALSLLGSYQGWEVVAAFDRGLASEDSQLRRTALLYLPLIHPEQLMKKVGPLLDDPVTGVRIEAARTLTRIPLGQLDTRLQEPFAKALAEFKATALYSADFAASRLNLGSLAEYQGDQAEAEAQFIKAVAIDRDYFAARTNLAVLYSRQGKNDLAEEQLRKALEDSTDLPDVHYSLGLLLSEQKKYEQAVVHLQKAADSMTANARVYYNLGQLLAFLRRDLEAEAALQQSIAIEPHNMQYLQALARFYLERRSLAKARVVAKQVLMADPKSRFGLDLLKFITEREAQKKE